MRLGDALRQIRPGTTVSFRFASPRPDQSGQDTLDVEVTFAGPDAAGTTYEFKALVEADLLVAPPVPAAGSGPEAPPLAPSRTQFTLGGTAALDLESGLLSSLNLESLLSFVPALAVGGPAGGPLASGVPSPAGRIDAGVKLTLRLVEVAPLP
jgi:hypothetical protein